MNHDNPKRLMYRRRTEFAISFSDTHEHRVVIFDATVNKLLFPIDLVVQNFIYLHDYEMVQTRKVIKCWPL